MKKYKQIKFLYPWIDRGKEYKKGQVVDISEAFPRMLAERVQARGIAAWVKEEAAPEAAVKPPEERAVKPKPKAKVRLKPKAKKAAQ